MLRSIGMDLTDEEFVELHGLLSSQTILAELYHPRIRNALGDARFVDFVRARDPKYQMLSSLISKAGISEVEFEEAYAMLSLAEADILASQEQAVLGDERIARREVIAQRNQQLLDKIGPEATSLLVTNFDNKTPLRFGARRESRR